MSNLARKMTGKTTEQGVLTLVTGTGANRVSKWAYVLIPPEKFLAFKQAEAAGNCDIANYGKVLAIGEGTIPPREIREHMHEKYGADEQFEQKMAAMIANRSSSGTK